MIDTKMKTKSEFLDFVELKFEECFSTKGYIIEDNIAKCVFF